MATLTLRNILNRAQKEKWATGHFNASELDHIRAIVEACQEAGAPAVVGMSEGERAHIGLSPAVAIRDAFRHNIGIPIFLNADHTKSVKAAVEAIEAGFDSVHIDLSGLSFEENIKGTREVVDYARKINPDISVEGELGYLKGESKIQHKKIVLRPEDYTPPEQALEYALKTEVDRLAIAVGNIHGISIDEPVLDIARIGRIRHEIPESTALVLHAGSGIAPRDIENAIEAGITNIHINTDLRVAYVNALRMSLFEHADEVAMYKLDAPALEAMKRIVKEKLLLFKSASRVLAGN